MKLNLKWVSDEIGNDFNNWRKGDVVKLQAQTGTGKTFFITGNDKVKGLVDRMADYETMIYICNRTELKRQIKLDLLKKFNQEVPYLKTENGEFLLDKNNEKILDTDILDERKKIENIVITSYHSISFGQLDNIYLNNFNNLDEFNYIICDECHFFMSDSGFNNLAYLALEELINTRHRNAIKIFISATMDEIDKIIDCQIEIQKEKGFGSYSKFTAHPYTTGVDYSYTDIKYFKDIKDIIQVIKNDKSDEKWIIFVTSKAKGEYTEEMLKEAKITATFIHANTENSDEKKRITAECKFNSKVLISTKCLDNGINIKDEKVSNMVIMAYDKTTFIQELGRIRVHIENAPIIKLYIPLFSKKNFEGKINKNYQPKIDDMELFWKDINEFKRKYNNNFNKTPQDIFYLNSKNEWTINNLGLGRVYKDRAFAIDMVNGFNTYDKFTFVKEQLSWLELTHTFSEINLIENVVDDEEVEVLENFLENAYNNDIRFEKEDFIERIENIIKSKLGSSLDEVLIKLDCKHKNRSKGLKQYNKLFSLLELSHVVSSKKFKIKGKLETKWIIIKIE